MTARNNTGEPVPIQATLTKPLAQRYELVLRSGEQERKLSASSCEPLAQAAALFIALLLDPGLELADAPAPNASSTANAKPVSSPQLTATPSLLAVVIAFGGRVDFGAWPSVEPGLVFGAGIERGRWQLLTRFGLGTPLQLDAGQGDRIKLYPITIALEPTYRWMIGAFGLEPSLGLELGVIPSRANALEPSNRTATSLAVLASARGSLTLGFKLRGYVATGYALPVIRPRWVLSDGEVLHRLGATLRTELGLEAAF